MLARENCVMNENKNESASIVQTKLSQLRLKHCQLTILKHYLSELEKLKATRENFENVVTQSDPPKKKRKLNNQTKLAINNGNEDKNDDCYMKHDIDSLTNAIENCHRLNCDNGNTNAVKSYDCIENDPNCAINKHKSKIVFMTKSKHEKIQSIIKQYNEEKTENKNNNNNNSNDSNNSKIAKCNKSDNGNTRFWNNVYFQNSWQFRCPYILRDKRISMNKSILNEYNRPKDVLHVPFSDIESNIVQIVLEIEALRNQTRNNNILLNFQNISQMFGKKFDNVFENDTSILPRRFIQDIWRFILDNYDCTQTKQQCKQEYQNQSFVNIEKKKVLTDNQIESDQQILFIPSFNVKVSSRDNQTDHGTINVQLRLN